MAFKSIFAKKSIRCEFIRKDGWLAANLPSGFSPPASAVHSRIEDRARATNEAGGRPLWEGYGAGDTHLGLQSRTSDQVRTDSDIGRVYSWLVGRRNSDIVVEFGTAFGVSGMYFLAGLAGRGTLFTFEPNEDWASFARDNLSTVGQNYILTNGIFEDEGPQLLEPSSVDVAFVDAIHTSDFVERQYEILKPLMKARGLVIFDDVNFSADMRDCWYRIANDKSIAGSVTVNGHVGIVELQ